jgi:acyl-CoA synthetase (AMP-forming)/AMP-acid ligase II
VHDDKFHQRDNVYSAIAAVAARQPEAEALINEGIRVTYGDLIRMTDACAAALTKHGVGAGDRISILSPPRPEVVIVLLACAKLGAIYLGLGTRVTRADLDYLASDAAPRLTFVYRNFAGRDYGSDIEAVFAPHGLSFISLGPSSDTLSDEFLRFLDVGRERESSRPVAPEHPLALIYTSGTTGPPKGVVISHRGILISANSNLSRTALNRVRVLGTLPIDHVGFMTNEFMMPLLAGGAIVQLLRFDVAQVFHTIEREKISLWLAIPTMLQRLFAAREANRSDLSSLELIWWPGPVALEVIAWLRTISRDLAVSYGMTEASGGITFSLPNSSDDLIHRSVGRPHDALELMIANERGKNESGEILIRGPQLMLGYWKKTKETEEALTEGGWFRTGDIGVLDNGELRIVGRIKELIRSGGYNISPGEVENLLEAHPSVAQAVVVGLPDDEFGEAVHAVVVRAADRTVTGEELRAFLREGLVGFKVPKEIWIWASLPLLANEIIDRKAVARGILADKPRSQDNR